MGIGKNGARHSVVDLIAPYVEDVLDWTEDGATIQDITLQVERARNTKLLDDKNVLPIVCMADNHIKHKAEAIYPAGCRGEKGKESLTYATRKWENHHVSPTDAYWAKRLRNALMTATYHLISVEA